MLGVSIPSENTNNSNLLTSCWFRPFGALHSKFQMLQFLEKGEQTPSHITRDHHVTSSLLYVWWQFSQERGEAAFCRTKPFNVY